MKFSKILVIGSIFIVLESFYIVNILFWDRVPGDDISEFIPPFLPLLNDFSVAPPLLACNIRKSMSQLTYNIMCYLNDPKEFERSHQSFGDTWLTNRKSCHGISKTEQSGNLTKFAFVRDPLDRFVSFFVDKCLRNNVCWNCPDDIQCVVRNIYSRLRKNVDDPGHLKMDYETWIDWHVAPQTWNCDFHKDFNDFHLIQIGPTYQQRIKALRKLKKVLEFAGVPGVHVSRILEGVKKEDTVHATYWSRNRSDVLRRIYNDDYVKGYLWKIYYHDYVAFGFNKSF